MTVDQRFLVMADWWPRLPPALQVTIMGLVFAVLGTLPHKAESPDRVTPAKA